MNLVLCLLITWLQIDVPGRLRVMTLWSTTVHCTLRGLQLDGRHPPPGHIQRMTLQATLGAIRTLVTRETRKIRDTGTLDSLDSLDSLVTGVPMKVCELLR